MPRKPTPKLKNCAHSGCRNKHQSTTGYCVDHAHEADKQRLHFREGRRCSDPHLVEEYTGITFPKVI